MTTPRRTPAASRTVMTELVLPADMNNFGNSFGGRLVAWADVCAAITAQRHCRLPVVTASIDRIDFIRPIRAGMFAILTGEITQAFHSSMEISVSIEGEEPVTGIRTRAGRALITMVALDGTGRPTEVPPLEFDTDEERARAVRAEDRRQHRIATRGPV